MTSARLAQLRLRLVPLGATLLVISCGAGNAQRATGGFVDITEESGIRFVHQPAVEDKYWLPESIGSGVALFDYDGDGDLDLYFLNGAWRDRTESPTPSNTLYRQRDDGTFEDVTESSGLGDRAYGQTAAAGDYDNDGDLDLYVANVARDVLYQNQGDGTFVDVTGAAGIGNQGWATAVTFVDVDVDGWLDIFVAKYLAPDTVMTCADPAGRQFYCPQYRFPGLPDVLYRNNGDGTFSDISRGAGIAETAGRALGAVALDFNDDGYPDIYVANDSDPNRLWINRGDGTFQDQAPPLGVAVNAEGVVEASMGIAVGDVANNGQLDLFLTHLRDESNTLYRRVGTTFRDESVNSGLAGPSIPLTGFGTAFLDFDHDMDLDLIVVNGRVFPGPLLVATESPSSWDRLAEPNMVFVQTDEGRFRNVSDAYPSVTGPVRTSRGLALGDLDDDGDLDLVLTDIGARPTILRNDESRGHWILVEARDPMWNRTVSNVSVYAEVGGQTLRRISLQSSSFMASNDPRVHFGLGEHRTVDEVRVVWPGGQTERFPGGPADRIMVLERGQGTVSRN